MTAIIRNTEKENKAIEIIAAEIAKVSPTAKADYGTLHASLGYTKRKSIARQMTGQFVQMLYKVSCNVDETDPTEIERMVIVNEIVTAALAK